MSVVLVFIHFVALFLYCLKSNAFLEALVKTFIINAVIVFFAVELLSAFNALRYTPMLLMILGSTCTWFFLIRTDIRQLCTQASGWVHNNYRKPIALFYVFIVLVPLLFLSIYTAPFISDALTYHLPRMEAWLQNSNVNFYSTNEIRNLTWGPLHEYLLLPFRILSDSDRFSSIVQYGAYVGCLALIWLISGWAGLSSRAKILALLIAGTISSVMFQATTPQGDLLAAFFFLAFLWYCRHWLTGRFSKKDYCYAVLAISLGTIAKYTILIFLLVPCVYTFILVIKYGFYKKKAFWLISLIFFCFTGFQWTRNYIAFGSIIQPKPDSPLHAKLGVEQFEAVPIAGNIIKNVAYHVGLPKAKKWNDWVTDAVNSYYHFWRVPVDDIKYTYYRSAGMPFAFKCSYKLDETAASSLVTAVLFWPAFIYAFIKRKNIKDANHFFVFGGVLLISYLLYSAVLKYSPFNGRYCIMPLLAASVLIGWWAEQWMGKVTYNLALLFLMISGVFFVFFNPVKSILPFPPLAQKTIIGVDRTKQLLSGDYSIDTVSATAFRRVVESLPTSEKEVGTAFSSAFAEYLIYALTNKKVRLENIVSVKELADLPNNQRIPHYRYVFTNINIQQFIAPEKIESIISCNELSLVKLKATNSTRYLYSTLGEGNKPNYDPLLNSPNNIK